MDDLAVVDEDSTVVVPVLTNDLDIDGGPIEIIAVGTPEHGTATTDGTTVTYTPAPDYFGQDTFTYTLNGTSTATVTITVTPVNDGPVAGDDVIVTDEITPVTDNVLLNDTDADGDTLTVTTTTPQVGTYGTLTISANGSYTYVPHGSTAALLYAGKTVNEQFTYAITDGHGGTSTATLTVTVVGLGDPIESVLWDQPIASWDGGRCSPCSGGLPAPYYDYRTFGSFTVDVDVALTGGRFALLDLDAPDPLNISIWDEPNGQVIHEITVSPDDYTRELPASDPDSGTRFWATVELPGWHLPAGDYYISVFSMNGTHLSWGFGPSAGDDVQLTGTGDVEHDDLYLGFSLSGYPW